MKRAYRPFAISLGTWIGLTLTAWCQAAAPTYFAHEVSEDRDGVIAPWYKGLNGQCDLRVRVAAETLKRYPWKQGKDGKSLPDYIYNGRWSIAADGKITPGELKAWGNGDLVQCGTYAIFGLVKYYAYSGDPAAIAHISLIADAMLDRCQTGPDHPWPNFIISVPNNGEPYGPCDAHGYIQLDLAAMAGIGLVQAYEVTGNLRWLDAAKHWADVLAAKRGRTPGGSPWNRYANPEDVHWNDRQTGGVLLIVRLFDELIRTGYTGENNAIIEARDAGRAYLRDVLLPRWYINDTFGRDYWDWEHNVQSEDYAEMVPRYMLRNPDAFPNWLTDARNIMSLFLTRACVEPKSRSGVHSGAWAYPEGSQCCGTSLDYAPMQVGAAFAEFGVVTGSTWARELARRSLLLATYDVEETGVVTDGIDGSNVVAGGWFQIAHPLPLNYVLDAMGWLPEWLGPNRENHIMRSSTIIAHVIYAPGRVDYTSYDAPAHTTTVLRLSFVPQRVTAEGRDLQEGGASTVNAYRVAPLPNGDCIVIVRHDGNRHVSVVGTDPQTRVESRERNIAFDGTWDVVQNGAYSRSKARASTASNASATFTFEGNQIRIVGAAGPAGGLADVYLDDVKQLCGIDYWNPYELKQQVVWYRNGLPNSKHTIRIVATGRGNPLSRGTLVNLDAIDTSQAIGSAGWGQGSGPTNTQRWVFGYTGRQDYVDSSGNLWRPATEVVIRLGDMGDPVTCWYVEPRRQHVAGTVDPVLYRHGMHGKDFTAFVTIGPGSYHVRVKLMESRPIEAAKRAMDISINRRAVAENLDIAATATRAAGIASAMPKAAKAPEGLNRAVDLVFNDVAPEHGVIAVRFTGRDGAEAVVSALEVGPGDGGPAAEPVPTSQPTAAR